MKPKRTAAQQSLQFHTDRILMPLPDKTASRFQIFIYAQWKYQGNEQKVDSFVAGWFMSGRKLSKQPLLRDVDE